MIFLSIKEAADLQKIPGCAIFCKKRFSAEKENDCEKIFCNIVCFLDFGYVKCFGVQLLQ